MRSTAKIMAVAAASTLMLMASTGTSVAQKKMAKYDTNKDGVVSMQEFKDGQLKNIEKRFGKIDVNADGVLDQEEIAAHQVRMKKRRDKKKAG